MSSMPWTKEFLMIGTHDRAHPTDQGIVARHFSLYNVDRGEFGCPMCLEPLAGNGYAADLAVDWRPQLPVQWLLYRS